MLFCRSPFRAGLVAQLVEQRTENPRVGGSIPSQATNSDLARTLAEGERFGAADVDALFPK